MKKFFSLFLVMILILNFVSFSYADNTIDRLIDVNPDAVISAPESSTPPETDDEDPDFGSEGAKPRWGILEPVISLIEDVLAFLPSMVLRLIYLIPTLDGIIFNTNKLFSITLFDPVSENSSVSAYLQSSISAVYNAFRYLVTAVYIVVLVYLAIRMMLSSVGRQKAKYKELFKYWLIGLLLLFSFHWVMAGVIWLSNTIVEILYNTTISMMASTTIWEEVSKVSHFSAAHYNQSPITDYIFYEITHFLGTVAEVGLVASVFGWALVFAVPILGLIFAILLIKSAFNIIITYFKRLFTILVLVLLFPIVVLSYVFDKIGDRKAQTLSIWIKEFVTNVMIQPIHALILAFIGIMFAKASSSLLLNNAFFGPIFCLLALRLIPMGEELLKKLFQISSQMGPGSHGIAGSVAQAGLALRGMREVTGSLKNNFSKARKLRELRQAETGLDSAFKTAAKGASLRNRAGGNWGIKGAVSALNDRKNSEAYKKYKKAIEKETGSKSLLGATTKAYAPAIGVVGGIGSAITGAGSGQFLSKAATNAAIEGALMGALANAPSSVSKFMHGDATKSEDYEKRANGLNNMSNEDIQSLLKDERKEDRKKIAIELGISEGRVKHLLAEGRTGELANAYRQVGNAMRWGVDKEEAKKYSSLYRAQADFDKKKLEAGGLYGVRNMLTAEADGTIAHIEEDGTYAYVDGNYLKISDTKSRGKAVSLNTSQLGKSVETVSQEILEQDKDYMTLKTRAQHTNDELYKDYTKPDGTKVLSARSALQQATDERDKVRDIFGTGSDEYAQANAKVTKTRERVDTLNASLRADTAELKTMKKNTVTTLLKADEEFQDTFGVTFSETAYDIVSKDSTQGTITPGSITEAYGSTTTVSLNGIGGAAPRTYTMATPIELMNDQNQAISNFNDTRIAATKNAASQVQVAQAAYNMVNLDSSKGQIVENASDYEIHVNAYDSQPATTFSIPKVTDPQVVRQAQQDVCVSILNQPEVRAEYEALQSDLASATTRTETSRVEKKITAFKEDVIEKTSVTIDQGLFDPSAPITPTSPASVFAGISIGQNRDPGNTPAVPVFDTSMLNDAMAVAGYSQQQPPIPPEPFAWGTCAELSQLLDSWQNKQITLVYQTFDSFSVDIENSDTEPVLIENVDSTSMDAIFGNSTDPVVLFYKDNNWYRR